MIHKHGVYVHFKGTTYKVIDVALGSETGETLVVYRQHRPTTEVNTWVRLQEHFEEQVLWHDGIMRPRFALQYIDPPEAVELPVEATALVAGMFVVDEILPTQHVVMFVPIEGELDQISKLKEGDHVRVLVLPKKEPGSTP